MKKLSLLFLGMLMAGCVYRPYDDSPEYSPGKPKQLNTFSTPRTFPVTGFAGCKDEAISCNCNYTSASPGEVVPTTICHSGYHRFVACPGFCPQGGRPWATVCTCN